jgi:hypothetical protein
LNLSRSQLADAANREPALHTCEHAPFNENFIGRIEQGRIGGGMCPERLAALCACLGVGEPGDIGLVAERRLPTRAAPTRRRGTRRKVTMEAAAKDAARPQNAVGDPMPVALRDFRNLVDARLDSKSTHSACRDVDHPSSPVAPLGQLVRRYIPFQPAALEGPAQRWLHGDPPAPAVNTGGCRVEPDEVQRVAERLQVLRNLDHGLGAGAVQAQVTGFVEGPVQRLLSGVCDDKSLRSELYRVAGGARELAGYQAVDSGADGIAQRHYLYALSLTQRGGERTFGAYLLGVSLGHLALHCGYPDRGLRMAQIALSGLPTDAPDVVHAGLWAVIARCHARMGDAESSTVALRTGERHLGRPGGHAPPEWISYLTPAYLADEVAHCMFDLDSHGTAQREVRQAVKGVGAGRVRRLAIDTALLASALAASGDVDEACARGRDAVDLAVRTTSMRAVQRVAQVRADLIPFDDYQGVIDLVNYMRVTLPAGCDRSLALIGTCGDGRSRLLPEVRGQLSAEPTVDVGHRGLPARRAFRGYGAGGRAARRHRWVPRDHRRHGLATSAGR